MKERSEIQELLMRVRTLTVVLILTYSFSVPYQSACAGLGQAPPTQQRKTSEPYTGDLSIFESPGRDERLHIDRVMDILGITLGKSVADIGAGSGWFSVRAAKRVGNGTVYAVDINPKSVQYIAERAQKEKLQNVKTILNNADDPQLPKDSVDTVLLLKTYHEVEHPVELLRNLRPALRAGAKIGIIDRNGNGEDHGVQEDVVIREAKEAGYQLAKQYDFVKGDSMDYFLVFTAAE
ncbi:MAG TPA: class I SAM-dependent methyltransferase [Dongiaceae bacterium]|nr:class I SAM-dependent methyltransferase [Dongiaceae bacterium]